MSYQKLAKKYSSSEIAESSVLPTDKKDRKVVLSEFKSFREKIQDKQLSEKKKGM